MADDLFKDDIEFEDDDGYYSDEEVENQPNSDGLDDIEDDGYFSLDDEAEDAEPNNVEPDDIDFDDESFTLDDLGDTLTDRNEPKDVDKDNEAGGNIAKEQEDDFSDFLDDPMFSDNDLDLPVGQGLADNGAEDKNDTVPDIDEVEEFGDLASLSSDELEAKLLELQQEASAEPEEAEEFTGLVDEHGTEIDSNSLVDDFDDNITVVSNDNSFISPSGEIVVMEPSDDEDNFQLIYVDIENITIAPRIRSTNNVEDLIKSIKSTGLLKPVDVAPMSAQGYYVLLDGYRRILACARAGKRRIPCIVNNKVSIPDIPILEAMYNHSKKYSIKEMVEYINYLEKQKGIMSASMIEYLLQLNSGDYTKLKDILNDNDPDIVDKLMNGTYTIDVAFKKLEQRRKKESAEEKELKRAAKVYDEGSVEEVEHIAESGEMGDESVALSDSEIKQLAVSASDIANVDDDNLTELIEAGNSIEGFEPHKQDPKYRERLDPALRKSVLARDHNTCQICEIASGMEFVEVLDVHHIQEVYLGGSDDINNLITACTVCHKLIHLHGRGELQMRPIEDLSPSEQKRFKRIIKLGNKIRMDMKMKGMRVEQLKKLDNTATIGRTKPGTGQTAG